MVSVLRGGCDELWENMNSGRRGMTHNEQMVELTAQFRRQGEMVEVGRALDPALVGVPSELCAQAAPTGRAAKAIFLTNIVTSTRGGRLGKMGKAVRL